MKDLKKTLEFCSFFSIFYSGCKWFGITAKLFGPTIKHQIQCFTTEIKCCLVLFFFFNLLSPLSFPSSVSSKYPRFTNLSLWYQKLFSCLFFASNLTAVVQYFLKQTTNFFLYRILFLSKIFLEYKFLTEILRFTSL